MNDSWVGYLSKYYPEKSHPYHLTPEEVYNIFINKKIMKLTLDIIKSYNFPEHTYKPDWDDVAVDFEINDITLTALTVCCNNPVKDIALEGLDGYLYIETKEELDYILTLTREQLLNEIKDKYPEFNLNRYL